jgi:putative molybdopterin biosynthesis protein
MADFLTTKELADLLRIKERKVYDLAAAGNVPCVRVVGKLLFPRREIDVWIKGGHSGPDPDTGPLPGIVAGSHDPLLDWALRQSGSGLAAFFDGSHDGLDRLASRSALAAGVHIHDADGWNTGSVRSAFANQPVVLVEFARRQRGLVIARGNPHGITSIANLINRRFARRQPSAASQTHFETLASDCGLDPQTLAGPDTPARTEDDVVRMVSEGKADAAFGLASVAAQFNLDFVPVLEERFDLLVWRRAWFEEPFQKFLAFTSSPEMAARANDMTGYNISNLGFVHFNGP